MSDPFPTPPHITLTIEELQTQLVAAQEEVRKQKEMLNRLQGLLQSAQGNIQRVTKELQVYLRDGILPE